MTLYLTRLPAFVLAAALASPAWAQDAPPGDTEIVVTAQAQNATVIKNGGSAGVLGDKPAEDLPFSIRSYDESLILNQQPQTLGEVLDKYSLPDTRTTVLHDWMKGRHSEYQEVNGLVVDVLDAAGEPAPYNAHVVALARRIESGDLERGPQNLELLLDVKERA